MFYIKNLAFTVMNRFLWLSDIIVKYEVLSIKGLDVGVFYSSLLYDITETKQPTHFIY